ncbi:Crp/Fnr family transcriptional regulator [Solwaraspora sp. WMMA2080]|uniref:Crp/Fnr family transcriptional regulator n=1 Tax=unclassified Solwaraspora TaxID=2627926 RepID=UPI00248C30F2|nr:MULTISPECIES: Crp/Fnr family transcriptional regulator [unclassified Solwaraspora]WBB95979.1 Crp/Fnr family transcriptional regulator [Solwaraspora sp. WMMA2059]WBC20117.1 Crp/Fnr family transcriptional regulator [Solwaraspora sp. WMMA2080]
MTAAYPVRVNFTNHVTAADWQALQQAGQPVQLGRKHGLFLQDEQSRDVFLLLGGAVKVYRTEANGSETMLTVRSTGDLLGDIAALDGTPRSASVSVLRPVTARKLTTEQFLAVVDDRDLHPALRRYTNARLRESDEQRVEIASLPVPQRLARALLRLAKASPDGPNQVSLDLGLSQDGLAQLIGASRNAVVTAISRFRDDRLIATAPRRFMLLDLGRLARIGYSGPRSGSHSST